MNTKTPRVVFDCNIFLQAMINRKGPAGQCLKLAENNEIRLFTSPRILAEIEEVLTRPAILDLIQNATIRGLH